MDLYIYLYIYIYILIYSHISYVMVLRQCDRMYSRVDIRRRAPIAFTTPHFQRCALWLKMATECNYIHTSVLHTAAECYVWSTKNQGLTVESYMQDSEVLWLSRNILHIQAFICMSISSNAHYRNLTVPFRITPSSSSNTDV